MRLWKVVIVSQPMTRIASPRLVPVVEMEPAAYATKLRESPGASVMEVPDQWQQYWTDCLTDSGIRGLVPVSCGSWFVSANDLERSVLSIVIRKHLDESGIPGFPDSDGEIEQDLHDRILALQGGFALFDGEASLIEPNCCCDLHNLDDWREALSVATSDWRDLWIGHPQLRVRLVGDDAEIRETQESNIPQILRHFVVSIEKLEAAIDTASIELVRFEQKVRKVLAGIGELRDYAEDQLALLSSLLTGR